MLIEALLGAAAFVQSAQPSHCPIIIAENFSILAFETGSARLSPNVRLQLDGWLRTSSARTYPTRFQLIGNADRVGTSEANRRLALRRANAVRDYLTNRGVAEALVTVRAMDEDQGLVDTADEVPEPQNRVVQLLALADPREPSEAPVCAPR